MQHLENIICFVNTCKSTDVTLRTILLKGELEEKVEEENDHFGEVSDRDDDSESVTNRRSESLKFKEEPDTVNYSSDCNSNKTQNVCCANCGENFLSAKSLDKHYDEIISCQPKNYQSMSLLNKGDALFYIDTNIGTNIKTEVIDQDKEFVRGKIIKGKRKFLCNYCGKNYTRKNGLDRHIMSHTGVKPFECKECGKCYITKDTLKTHILIHSGIKTHKCEICQKLFMQSSHLNYHMRRHAGDKPHTCSFCGKGFLSTYHLERHKLMHTGVKPFKCDLCNKQFVRSTTLRDHLLLHTGERPYQCQHCGKQFNRKQTLSNHVNLVHIFADDNIPKIECN